jgi:hypothetical protein
MSQRGDVPNFASFLRVAWLHRMRSQEAHIAEPAARHAAPGNAAVVA